MAGLALLLALIASSCIDSDSFSTDKISEKIELDDIGLNLKLATAKLTLGEIFPETPDTIKYYESAEGKQGIMFYAEQKEVVKFGIDNIPALNEIPQTFTPVYFTGTSTNSPIDLSIPLQMDGISISTIDTEMELSVDYADMLENSTLQLDFPSSSSEQKFIKLDIPTGRGSLQQSIRQKVQVDSSGNLPLTLTVHTPAGASSTQPGNITISYSPAKIYSIKGKISRLEVDVPQSSYEFDFGQLEKITEGIRFFDPRIIIPITDDIGLSGESDFQLTAQMSDSSKVPIKLSEPLLFNPQKQRLQIDNSNSNIASFSNGSLLPKKIDLSGKIAFFSNDDEVELNETSQFSADCSMEIPLDLSINSSFEVDTTELNADFSDEVRAATLCINSLNELPMDASVQLGFFDEDTKMEIDQVEVGLLKAAPVSTNGIVTTAVTDEAKIELDAEKLKNLGKAEKLIIRLKLATTDHDKEQNVLLLTNYKLNFDINIKGKLKANF